MTKPICTGFAILPATQENQHLELGALELDITHDRCLSNEDLNIWYGKSATQQYGAALLEALRQGNNSAFYQAKKQLNGASIALLAQRYQEYLALTKKQESRDPFTQAALLTLADEFSYNTEYEMMYLAHGLQPFWRQIMMGNPMDVFDALTGNFRAMWSPKDGGFFDVPDSSNGLGSGQHHWSVSEQNEAQQHTSYDRHRWNIGLDIEKRDIEKLYDIDLRSIYHSITDEELATLDTILDEIARKRPSDLQKITSLTLSTPPGKVNFAAQTYDVKGMIDINITQRPAHSDLNLQSVSQIAQHSFASDFLYANSAEYSNAAFLRRTLMHELGHIMALEHKSEYANLFSPTQLHPYQLGEMFAEDYCTYLMNNGEKVVETNLAQEKTLAYQERLKFFQKNFPLQQK